MPRRLVWRLRSGTRVPEWLTRLGRSPVALPGGVVHAECDDEPGGGGEDADDDDRGGFVDSVGGDANEEAAGGVAEVAPEAGSNRGRGRPRRGGGGHR